MTAMQANTLDDSDSDDVLSRQFSEGDLVTLDGVTKSFGPTVANSEISLAVARGDVLGLVGGNGAGKSTLMSILCGVTKPDAGSLAFAGKPLSFDFYNASDAQSIGIRIVHQELSLCNNLTVAENFFLEAPKAATHLPGWRNVYKERARSALDAVFPGNAIEVDREVGSLPIGERQMVEIARAAATPNVRLIVLDEPTSSLGPERSQQLRAYVHAQAAKGLSFIFISHKLFEIVDVATRVAVLRNGRLVWIGDTKEIGVPDLVRMMGGEAAELPEVLARKSGFRVGGRSGSNCGRRGLDARPRYRAARGGNRRPGWARGQRSKGSAPPNLLAEPRQAIFSRQEWRRELCFRRQIARGRLPALERSGEHRLGPCRRSADVSTSLRRRTSGVSCRPLRNACV